MNHIKYKHYRYTQFVLGKDMNEVNEIIHNLGGYTMAYQELDNGDFLVGVSRCSDEDNFSKLIGRGYAWVRLNFKPITVPKEDFLSHMKLVHDAYDMADSDIARKSLGRGKKGSN